MCQMRSGDELKSYLEHGYPECVEGDGQISGHEKQVFVHPPCVL